MNPDKGGFVMLEERKVEIVSMSQVALQEVQWLLKPYIPFGKITIKE